MITSVAARLPACLTVLLHTRSRLEQSGPPQPAEMYVSSSDAKIGEEQQCFIRPCLACCQENGAGFQLATKGLGAVGDVAGSHGRAGGDLCSILALLKMLEVPCECNSDNAHPDRVR